MTTELFPIVNEQGECIGSATRKECHSGTFILHPVVHLHVFNPLGHLLLQKRSLSKDIQPGRWDTAVGGHVDYGESIEAALHREARAELGIEFNSAEKIVSYVFTSKVERELVNTFRITTTQEHFNFDPVELDDVRFWSIDEIRANLGKGIFTPNFESEFTKYLI